VLSVAARLAESAEAEAKHAPGNLHLRFARESLGSPEASVAAASVSAAPAAVPVSLGVAAEETVARLESSRAGPPRRPVPVPELIAGMVRRKVGQTFFGVTVVDLHRVQLDADPHVTGSASR